MRSKPQKYGKKLHLGWQAYKKYNPLHEHVVAHLDTAKKLCEKDAKCTLNWVESDGTNPNGHHWYHGGYDEKTKDDWTVSGIYEDVKENIPDAEFISEDLKCGYYISPSKEGWDVRMQIDLSDRDPYQLWLASGANGYYYQAMDNARLWDFLTHKANTKEEAKQLGYYFWARDLIRKIDPPMDRTWFMRKLRNLARKLI